MSSSSLETIETPDSDETLETFEESEANIKSELQKHPTVDLMNLIAHKLANMSHEQLANIASSILSPELFKSGNLPNKLTAKLYPKGAINLIKTASIKKAAQHRAEIREEHIKRDAELKLEKQKQQKRQFKQNFYQIAEFTLRPDQFTRIEARPNDCVINAIQLIGGFDAGHSEVMRILVGDIGITKEKIVKIFNRVLATDYIWKFVRYDNMNRIIKHADNMPNNTVIFCGCKTNNIGHVFLIDKNNDIIRLIDPQMDGKVCPLTHYINGSAACLNYIKDADMYFILQKSRKPTERIPAERMDMT
jgi:hypothetical protein